MRDKLRPLILPASIGGLTTLLHLMTAADSYGLFRDEFYYLACGRHPGLGYVDQPPLIGLIAWTVRNLLGSSMLAVRVVPAVAAGLTVLLTGLMARELGGGRFAQALAAVVTALAPTFVGNFGFLSMNALDVLFWAAAVWIVMRILRTGDERLWIAFGVVAGLGLENKLSMLFLGFGLTVGLLTARRWEVFRGPWFYAGGGIAIMLFTPHLIWQVANGWPTLTFMANATQNKNLPLAPWEFLTAQVLPMNPLVVPLALAGLAFYLFSARGKSWRALGYAFIVIVIVLISRNSKAYYLSPAYPMLFAAGAVALGSASTRRHLAWVRPAALTTVVITGLVLAPLAKPILPVELHVAYTERLGVAPSTGERKELGRLSQFFADRLGWEELAGTVSEIYRALPEKDRERACVFGQNYGQAGAIDFYRDRMALPPAISGHNSYHLWGPGDCSGEVLIVMGDDRESLSELFERVELAATYTCDDCMPYENDKPIWLCRNMRLSPEQLWPRIGHYD